MSAYQYPGQAARAANPLVPPRPSPYATPAGSSSGLQQQVQSLGPPVYPMQQYDEKQITEVKLFETNEERDLQDKLSDLYSIIVATERLEAAYVKDLINPDEYTQACQRLIGQFKTLRDAVHDTVEISKFMGEHQINCKAAVNRLIVKGVPATIEHGGVANDKGDELTVFHSVQHFITTLDSLKLEMRAADELHPHLSELLDSLNKVADLPEDHESKTKVKQWLLTLNQMRAHDELTDAQVRQMIFDLETAYNAFHKHLQKRGRK